MADNRMTVQSEQASLCSDCPPVGYPTDETRCTPCPRRALSALSTVKAPAEVVGETQISNVAGGLWALSGCALSSHDGFTYLNGPARALIEQAAKALSTPTQAEAKEAGIREAAKVVDKRRDDYISEHGSYDHTTGMTEYPGDGDQYVYELEEIADSIRALLTEGEADHG